MSMSFAFHRSREAGASSFESLLRADLNFLRVSVVRHFSFAFPGLPR